MAKTEGIMWLMHSFSAFNGSGYADYDSIPEFVQSYVDYKKWKKDSKAVELAELHRDALSVRAGELLEGDGSGHIPSDRNKARFAEFRATLSH